MITSRILGKSRGLVFGLMVGGRLRFDDDCMRLNWGSELMEKHLDLIMVVYHLIPLCNEVSMQHINCSSKNDAASNTN